jgi:HD-GYP domain-containing protein (c-di-GMP phosphodiesterase class II)
MSTQPNVQEGDSVSPANGSVLQILDRLVKNLQGSGQPLQQIRSTLKAVQESTRADAVFWFPCSGGLSVVAGDLPPETCIEVANIVLEGVGPGEDHILWSRPADAGADSGAAPRSAVLVRIGRVRPAWLVAVNLDPDRPLQHADLELLLFARRLLHSENQHSQLNARLKESLVGLIQCLTVAIDAKDACTAGHSERVARIAKILGKHMELPAAMINDIFLAGLLHDVGKIGVLDAVLHNPGRLTRREFMQVQEHTVIGDSIVSKVPQLDHLRPGIRGHHERYDGKGYPDGLAGEDIPLMARVLAVADSCDAMMSSRRYRAAIPPPQIDAIFEEGSGKQWDPKVVTHFMACRPQIYPPIYQKGIGDSALHAVGQIADVKEGSSLFYKVFVPEPEQGAGVRV